MGKNKKRANLEREVVEAVFMCFFFLALVKPILDVCCPVLHLTSLSHLRNERANLECVR